MELIFIFDLDDTLLNSKSYKTYSDIKKRKKLRNLLFRMKNVNNPFYIYTNGTYNHAKTSLINMGIIDLFDKIFARDTIPYMKPHYLSYKHVNDFILNNHYDNYIIFFDDMVDNINMANNFNWNSIHITKQNDIYKYLNYLLS